MKLEQRYLELVKSTLSNQLYIELEAQLLMSVLCAAQDTVLDLKDFRDVRRDGDLIGHLLAAKQEGDTILLETPMPGRSPAVDGNLRNFTEFAYTMVGRKRLDHLQSCVERVIDEDVPGDLIEAGVWRGGCCILMRAVLAAHGCNDRTVWVADSFAGLPVSPDTPDQSYAMDASRLPVLAVSEDEVRENFSRFGLLDAQVRFLPGWFEESLPGAETGPLALLRLDCDLYSSTMSVLESLYDRVSSGGWVIIDDYGILPPCKQAVDEFRKARKITCHLQEIDAHAVCWQV